MDARLSDEPRPRLDAPPAVRWIVETLEEAGFETWTVGGAVRDALLGFHTGDWDLATRATPRDMRRIFRRTVPIGIEHGTVGVLARDGTLYEVTTFRRDVITTGRHAVVEFADRLEDDLGRRDFTINAIAWHPLRDVLSDPFGGADDLRAGVLRTVGEPERRFEEDYLRVLRALRFAGRFGLDIEPATWRALTAAVPRLDGLSRERVREELMKVLAGDADPTRSLSLWRASGALARVASELEPPAGATLSAPEGPVDGWRHGLAVVRALPRRRPLLRLAALLQGAAVAAGDEPDAAKGRAARLTIRLRFSNAQVERVSELAGAPLAPPDELSPPTLRRWLARMGPERLRDVTRLWLARARVLGGAGGETARSAIAARSALLRELRAHPPLAVGDLAIGGRELIHMGMKPGPGFRRVLDALLERVLDDPALNTPERLAELVPEVLESLEEGGGSA